MWRGTDEHGGASMGSGGRDDGPGVVPAWAPPAAAAAGLAYNTWIAGYWLNPHVDPLHGYVSELSARDQPYAWLFGGGDLVFGVLVSAVALLCLVTLRQRGWSRLGFALLAVCGLATVADALLPLDCAPYVDTTCSLREWAGTVSFAHQAHAVTSSVAMAAGIISMPALTIAARRYRWWPAVARLGGPLFFVEAAAAIATLPLMFLGSWLGIAQRAQVLLLSAWPMLLAYELWAGRHSRPEPPGLHRPATADRGTT